MEYIKLIALDINDFCSSIFIEHNYAVTDIDNAVNDKDELELQGYLCILVKAQSDIQV